MILVKNLQRNLKTIVYLDKLRWPEQNIHSLGTIRKFQKTFTKIDNVDLNYRKYPIYMSGHYSKEPQFGELIRVALEIGYTIFPYEHSEEGSGKPREIGEAKNIANYLRDKPDIKLLIHCGYAHATEGKMGNSWEKAMAGRLLEFTGINPLTINQTRFDNKFILKHLSPLQKRI